MAMWAGIARTLFLVCARVLHAVRVPHRDLAPIIECGRTGGWTDTHTVEDRFRTTTRRPGSQVNFASTFFVPDLNGRHHGCWSRHWGREDAARAAAAFDASARTADRRDGARSGFAPQLWCEARRGGQSATGRLRAQLVGALLAESGVQGGSVALRCPDSGAPSLAMPCLAGRAAELVDPSSLRFLLAAALATQWKMEEDKEAKREAKREETQQLAADAMERARPLLERNKRKRKRKLPRASFFARAVCTWKSGHFGHFIWEGGHGNSCAARTWKSCHCFYGPLYLVFLFGFVVLPDECAFFFGSLGGLLEKVSVFCGTTAGTCSCVSTWRLSG